MAEAPIIIIKKIQGGHAAAHGGAWKVAFADFMTAMMCFFLVMWLMGTDEETKAAIEQYFNNPNVPWKSTDTNSPDSLPVGDRDGQGDGLLKGMNGAFPEDMVSKPIRPVGQITENMSLAEQVEQALDGQAYAVEANADEVRFSLPDKLLFKPGSNELTLDAIKSLGHVSELLAEFRGFVKIEGHTDTNAYEAGVNRSPASPSELWQLSFDRAASVMNYLVTKGGVDAAKLHPIGSGPAKLFSTDTSADARNQNRRVEFRLSLKKEL